MTLGYWVSDDLVNWENHRLPAELPLYDYAPDVRVLGEYVYFCASKMGQACDRYRTKDIENGPYECIKGSFDYWDPNLFVDDDGRVYFYWGCSNVTPIWGVELDPASMEPIGERKELIYGNPEVNGFERVGENNSRLPKNEEEVEAALQHFVKMQGISLEQIPEQHLPQFRGMFTDEPYIEGAWMDKHQGKYYLQYAFGGAEYNIYGDGVYVGDSPLGPFTLAKNNPYSFHPGGFLPGAGHGSTMGDSAGNLWHTSTMRISVNHSFERRVGLWPAGFDKDGELFCNQRYGDWPIAVKEGQIDPWDNPEWMLLSYGKKAKASSERDGRPACNIANENVQNWWQPASNSQDEWVMLDLGKAYDVRAIQINFGDDEISIPVLGEVRGTPEPRYIEEANTVTRYLLEGSLDGEMFFVIEDKTQVETDLSHDFLVVENGMKIRYIKLSKMQVPYDQIPAVSGIRVFGNYDGKLCKPVDYTVVRTSGIDMEVEIEDTSEGAAIGYNVLWSHEKNKLYHSYMTFEKKLRVGALVEGQSYYVRVDSFNESGITEGKCVFVE